jgi:gamma-glutamylcyclotransferase (GGCT)/AIG2-like uncharacterized protein YtfP
VDQPPGGPLTTVFVYGTLKAGHCRWPLLEPYVLDGPSPATVPGRVYDTGLDFPAARFDHDGTIHGEVFEVREDALPLLDEVEGAAHGLYGRVEVTTDDGRRAWAYEFGGEVDTFVDLDGRWTGA